MTSKPGMKGPKPSYDEGSVDVEIALIVRPQKLPDAKRILARSFLTPFTS